MLVFGLFINRFIAMHINHVGEGAYIYLFVHLLTESVLYIINAGADGCFTIHHGHKILPHNHQSEPRYASNTGFLL